MIKAALQFLTELARESTVDVDARTYSTLTLNPIVPPKAASLEISTLDGFVQYVQRNMDALDPKEHLVEVVSPSVVRFISTLSQNWRMREVPIEANRKHHAEGFAFGRYLAAEQFNVELQSRFVRTPERDKVLALVGNMKDEVVTEASDDGTTQSVACKAGVVLRSSKDVPNPVMLAPYRTFVEVDQPISAFVFRVRKGGGGTLPECALFEADGGKWQLDAIKSIKEYLVKQLPSEVTVIG